MNPAQSWGVAQLWSDAPGVRGGIAVFQQLLFLPLFPLAGLLVIVEWPVVWWFLFAAMVMLVAYVLISALIYRVMVTAGNHGDSVVLPLESNERLNEAALKFGSGIGIATEDWSLVVQGDDGCTAVAPMPAPLSHSLVTITAIDGESKRRMGFVGRAPSGRLLMSTFMRPMFPFKDIDWVFDVEASPYELWMNHCELVDGPVTLNDYLTSVPQQNLAQQAGLVRMLRTWGRTVLQKRGLVSGF